MLRNGIQKLYFYNYANLSNFHSKYTNGNRQKSGMRICHWNKSNSKLQSKMSEIKKLINIHKPHIFGISEANLSVNQDQTIVSIPDYKLYVGPSSQTGLIRLVVYVHKEVSSKLRPDLMDPTLNSVWLEASLKNSKNVLINQT